MKLGPIAAALLLPVCAAAFVPGTARAQQPQRGAATLATYAEAYLDISEINADHDARIRALRDPAQIASAEQQSDSARLIVLEEHEMTPEEYDAIQELIQTDAEVRQEFEMHLARARQQREAADTLPPQPTTSPGLP